MKARDPVVPVDDLPATGGTLAACRRLVESLGGTLLSTAFLIEPSCPQGRENLKGCPDYSLVKYD
jgi:adenine phosphoribosyltransferase